MMADRDRSQRAVFWEDLKPVAYCIYDVPKICFCALKFKNLVVKWGKLIRYTEIHMPKWHILRPPPTGKKTLFSGHWEYQVPMRSLCGGSSRRVLIYTWCPSVIIEGTCVILRRVLDRDLGNSYTVTLHIILCRTQWVILSVNICTKSHWLIWKFSPVTLLPKTNC